ncbi:MAG: hypothetical protein HQK52_19780 [Oligoflexia bacterium]|nr:hypothetical protein [Oligoflexia bacterium]
MKKTLKDLIDQYLDFRKSFGCSDQYIRLNLYRFYQYLVINFPSAKTITRPMLVGFLGHNKNLHPNTLKNSVSCIKHFCLFLVQHEIKTYVPVGGEIFFHKKILYALMFLKRKKLL